MRRDVLQRVDDKVDLVPEQGIVEFLGEQAFLANLG